MSSSHTIKVAISPCPNDTFIFDALLNDISNCSLNFEVDFFDIQKLNEIVLTNQYDLIKVSFAMLPKIQNNYTLLKTGAALGDKNGPLLVAKKGYRLEDLKNDDIILSPGKNTTAQLLLNKFYPQFTNIQYVLFSEIEGKILDNKAQAGIVIHEGRFVYQKKGLTLLQDLGHLWQQKTQMPIPLGCLVINKKIEKTTQHQIQKYLQQSILMGKKKLPLISTFIKHHAQEMQEDVILKHINLYVNDNTYELNKQAINAIEKLLNININNNEKKSPDKRF